MKLLHRQTGHTEDGWSCGSCCHCSGSVYFLSSLPFHSLLHFCHLCFSLPHCLTVHWEIHTQKLHTHTHTDTLSLFLVCTMTCANTTKETHTAHAHRLSDTHTLSQWEYPVGNGVVTKNKAEFCLDQAKSIS